MSAETTTRPNLDTTFANKFRGTMDTYNYGMRVASDRFHLSDEDPEKALVIEEGQTKKFQAAGGQVLTATLFNQGQENLTLIHPGWLGDGEHALTKLQINLFAQQNPDTTFAYMNMPGIRGSEALPVSVMKELKRTGSFEAYGEQIAEAVHVLVQDFERTKGVGWSTGARAMLGILAARHQEAGINEIVAIDPPGSRKLGLTGIFDAFVVKEGGYAKAYTPDAQTVEAKKIGAPKLNSPFDAAALKQAFYDFPVAMSRAGLEIDLTKAATGLDGSHRISVVSPEMSALNRPHDVAEIMRRVSLGTDAELIHYIIDKQSHTGIMDQDAPLFAQLVTDTLKSSKK